MLQRAGDFLDLIGFQNVPFLQVVEARQFDATFESFADLLGVVLFSFQRIERIVADPTSIAIDADPTPAFDRARQSHGNRRRYPRG